MNDLLVADLFYALTGEQHPARPSSKEAADSQRAKALAAALRAQQERLKQSKSED